VEPVATPAPLLRHALSRLGHSLVHQGTEHGTPWPHRDTLLVSLDAEKRHHQEDDPETGHGHVTGPGVLRDLDLLLLYGQVHLYLSFSGWVPCGAHPLSDRDERASRPASRYGRCPFGSRRHPLSVAPFCHSASGRFDTARSHPVRGAVSEAPLLPGGARRVENTADNRSQRHHQEGVEEAGAHALGRFPLLLRQHQTLPVESFDAVKGPHGAVVRDAEQASDPELPPFERPCLTEQGLDV